MTALDVDPAAAAGRDARSIPEVFRQTVVNDPAWIAIESDGRSVTRAELDAMSDAIAAAVVTRRAPRDVAVGVMTRDRATLAAAVLAVLKAGHFVTIIDPEYPPDRIELLLEIGRIALLLHDSTAPYAAANGRGLDLDGALRGGVAPISNALVAPPSSGLRPPSPPASRVEKGNEGGGAPDLAPDDTIHGDALGARASRPQRPGILPGRQERSIGEIADDEASNVLRSPNALATLVFTSGSTGTPRAYARTHAQVIHGAVAIKQRFEVDRSRVAFVSSPASAAGASELFLGLLGGATLCFCDARGKTLGELAAWVVSERIEVLRMAPALLRRLLAAAPDTLRASRLRAVTLGSDVVTVADIEAWRRSAPERCELHVTYASTELGALTLATFTGDTVVDGPLAPIGKPLPGVEITLVREDGSPSVAGEVGEIVVRRTRRAAIAWPSEVALLAVPPEAAHTGDLARCDANGVYFFVGRKDALLKIKGHRVEPAEVEAALLRIDGIAEAAVVGKPDSHGTVQLVAYVVMRGGTACAPSAIRARLRDELPAAMVPSRIIALDSLPLTTLGKIDRRGLTARVETIAASDGDDAMDDLERQLCGIWSRVLGVPVRRDDDFFEDLGGESLAAAHVVTEVHAATGRSIPLSLLVELNTVARMAAHLRRAAVATDDLVVAIRATGAHPPLFCVAGAGGSVMFLRQLAAALGDEQPFYGVHHHGFAPRDFPHTLAAMAASFFDAIRRVQQRGPYFLAGYSLGGEVAYELARQITAAGEKVAFVGLFDTAVINARASVWTRLIHRVRLARRHPYKRAVEYAREIYVRSRQSAERRLRDRLQLRRAALPAFLATAEHQFMDARNRFTFEPYPGRVTLFRASDGMRRIRRSPDLGWSTVEIGSLHIVDVEGDHLSMLTSDVHSLAAGMTNALAAARAEAAR